MSNQSHNGRPSLFDIATENLVLPIFERFQVQTHMLEGRNFFPEARMMHQLQNKPASLISESLLIGEIRMPQLQMMVKEWERPMSEGNFLFDQDAFQLRSADDEEKDNGDWDEEEDEDWDEDEEDWEEDEDEEDWDEEDEDWDEDEDQEDWEEEEPSS